MMIPCKKNCDSYSEGCHKTCVRWKEMQAAQRIEREKQKAYLHKYAELDRMTRHQYEVARHVWG